MSQKYDQCVGEWELLIRSLEANAADLPHLEIPRANLQDLLNQVRILANQQDLHRSTWQQTSKRLAELLDGGLKLATFLRTGLKQFYGKRSDKLVEFGIQPFRGLRRAEPEPPPEKEEPAKGS
ncbi:MAG TPA: hypothetical protein VE078_12670 [Thermoanaerobaculia bacterium]|nr:hypothetical protein [Thermoanaerobaculia bacterium]